MATQGKIYTTNPKTDGWKAFPNAETKTVKIDMKQRGIQEREITFNHYCVNGKTLCGLTEEPSSTFYNDPRNQCDGCRAGLRTKTKHDFALRDANDETENVIDYKAAAAKDNA